jgi:AcrR family transcriptional regulator
MTLTLRERQKLQTRGEILQAAWALTVKQGMTATKMSEIAALVGVSEQTVYNHFPTKDELTLALLDEWSAFSELLGMLAEVPEELSPAESLVDLMRRMEWPDTEAEQRALDFFLLSYRDPQLRAAYLARQERASQAMIQALAGRARRHRVSPLALDLMCRLFYTTGDVVALHQGTTVKKGRWRRDLLRELERVMGAFR